MMFFLFLAVVEINVFVVFAAWVFAHSFKGKYAELKRAMIFMNALCIAAPAILFTLIQSSIGPFQ